MNEILRRLINANIKPSSEAVDVFLSEDMREDAHRTAIDIPPVDLRNFDELYSFEGMWS